jgi:hypothetical protein
MRWWLLWLVLLMLASTRAQAAIYYLATSGGGGCSTNKDSPSGNLSNSLGCLTPGDILYFRAGTYNIGTGLNNPPGGNSSNRVTIAGFPDDGTKVVRLNVGDGSSNGVNISSSSWITFDNLVFDCSNAAFACFKTTGSARRIRVQNSEIRNAFDGSCVLDTTSASALQEFVNLDVHGCGNSDLDHGFYLQGSDILIERCDIHDNSGYGIQIYDGSGQAAGNVFRRNRIFRNGYNYPAAGVVMGTGDNNQGYNNLVYDNGGGIQIRNGGTNNAIYNNTIHGNSGGDSGGPCILNDNSGSIIRNNICSSNASDVIAGGGSATASNNLFGDPGYVNAGAKNFQLSGTNTAAIDNGTSLSSIFTTDFDGNARPAGSGWDRGAYEFGSSGCTGGCGTPGCPACTCTGGCGTPGCPACPSTTPIAWWKFDENTGTVAADFTGNGHTGELVNGATWGSPRVGTSAVAFDGVNDAVTVPDPILASFTTDHTICLWALTLAPTAIGSGGFKQTLLNLASSSSDGLRWVIVENSTPPGTWFVTNVSGGTPIVRTTTGATFTANTWVHLCETLIGGSSTLYVNGALPASASSSDRYDPATATVLGARTVTDGTLAGELDQVKIWNRGLSASEVATEYGGVVGTGRAPRHRTVNK